VEWFGLNVANKNRFVAVDWDNWWHGLDLISLTSNRFIAVDWDN